MINYIKDAIEFASADEKVNEALKARNHPSDYEPIGIQAKSLHSNGKYDRLIRINFDYMRKSTYAVQREDYSVLVGMRDESFVILESKAVEEIED